MEENIVLKLDSKGRLTIPLKIRKDFHINPGDIFFVKPEDTGLYLAKAKNPFDDLAEHAVQEHKSSGCHAKKCASKASKKH